MSGRGRTRVFCGDACSRRFHNAARPAGGDGGAVSSGQAADPLGALEALIRRAGALVTLARGQVAALDAEASLRGWRRPKAGPAPRQGASRHGEGPYRRGRGGDASSAWKPRRPRIAAGKPPRLAPPPPCSARPPGPAPSWLRSTPVPALTQKPPRATLTSRPADTTQITTRSAHGQKHDQAGEQAAPQFALPSAWLARAGQGEAGAAGARPAEPRGRGPEQKALTGHCQTKLQTAEQLAAAEHEPRPCVPEQRLDTVHERHDRPARPPHHRQSSEEEGGPLQQPRTVLRPSVLVHSAPAGNTS